MENQILEKNSKLNKDTYNTEELTLKYKIFNFFFYVLRKKDINMFLCSILLLLETLQLISYAFSEIHMKTWKINLATMEYVRIIIGSIRISPLMQYLSFNFYIIIFSVVLSYIFIHSLLFAMVIKFNKPNSKFYQLIVAFTRYFTTPLIIFFMIPISEIILLPLKCKDNKMDVIKDPIPCYEGLHYLYVVLGVFFAVVFYLIIFLSCLFYFDPFNNKKTTTKINTSADTFLFICKIVFALKFILITNDYINIVIMVVLALFNLKNGIENPTYNNYFLECFISIRNATTFWTYCVLLIGKLTENSKINGIIYLLLFGYPLIIAISIIYYQKESQNFMIASANFNDVNEYLIKIRYMIKLIDSYLNKSKSGKNKNNIFKKNEILLKGIIAIHEEGCINEECPLKKFQDSTSNYSAQKTCLLHYMNNLFVDGIKKFPNSRVMLLIYVQFNYEKKYNLNAAKTYLTKLEKQNNTLTENYIIFSIKQSIQSNNNNNQVSLGVNDSEDNMKIEDTIDQKYKRLKFLVESTTKLYGEFWGILATNLTNNLNLNKLFIICNKLNKFLNEINSLWENDLRNKKIDLENQSVAQLYSYFLREILKNKKRSEEIAKKINEEQHFESRKANLEKFDMDNLDIILENQDYVLFCRANEKGECDIIQCSNSVVYMLGFIKQELIGKSIETIMPGAFSNEHSKMLSTRIKTFRSNSNSHKDNFRASDKKHIFILPKTKVGYLTPVNCKFTIYNDDDFSNTYIIKSKFESKDTKSLYAFYILTKDDFSVDSISSSSINLGLSMDLLKKYVINMNILVRSESSLEDLNLNERYIDFEEEPRKVTWIYPDKIYPKNDTQRNNQENLDELIKVSENKEFMLLITKMKYNEDETVGYCFRFTEVDNKKGVVEPGDFRPNSTQHILFDMLRLNYIRTILVTQKSPGAKEYQMYQEHNMANREEKENVVKDNKKTKKKDKTQGNTGEEYSDEDSEQKIENILTKEKIIELQGKGHGEIKDFIFGMPFFGNDVSLEKHRPNKERYPVGRAQEPEIKIAIAAFIKRVEEKMKIHPDRKFERKKSDSSINSSTVSTASTTSIESTLSSEFTTDSTVALTNVFNGKSVTYIRFFSLAFFLCICAIISAEFAISLSTVQDSSERMGYMDKAFIMLNSLVYTKFFLTEVILAQNPLYTNTANEPQSTYIMRMMNEMSNCRQTFSSMYSFYSNATVSFSKAYNTYITETQVCIRTTSNGIASNEIQPFSTAMSRIPTSIFYVSTVTDGFTNINMSNRNAYELMMNLLNDYFLVWRDVTFLLVEDTKDRTVSNRGLVVIFVFSFILSVMSLFILWKLITRFIDDREKPIDLFLTIKKAKFEELKNVSENFVNKLLNKFFGNEENEEESLIDYSTNIKADDINIIKFKQKNEYKQSLRTSSEYLFNYIRMVIFFVILQAYMTFKFCYNKNALINMNQFCVVFNSTHYSQSDIILSLDISKSFFFDPNIPIYNKTNQGKDIFISNLIDISDSFESLLTVSYNTSCFLKGDYVKQFYNWMNNDIRNIIDDGNQNVDVRNEELFEGTLKDGFKSTMYRFFELCRFIGITYLRDGGEPIEYAFLSEFNEINQIVINVIRPWYNNVILLINKEFNDYVSVTKLVNVASFIVLVACVIVLYFLVWRAYEDNLRELLKTSVDLINLIPEEIKFQIVQKLNEEESKSE